MSRLPWALTGKGVVITGGNAGIGFGPQIGTDTDEAAIRRGTAAALLTELGI